jgi:hypothetical protein
MQPVPSAMAGCQGLVNAWVQRKMPLVSWINQRLGFPAYECSLQLRAWHLYRLRRLYLLRRLFDQRNHLRQEVQYMHPRVLSDRDRRLQMRVVLYGSAEPHQLISLACPAGCSACRLKQGTTETAICTSCRPNLTLNTADPARCVSRGICTDGQYWDTSTTSCLS